MNIQEFVESAGGIDQAADVLGVGVSSLKHWRYGVRPVPPGRVLPICEASSWRMTPHEIAPQNYPNPMDGVPSHVRRHFDDGSHPSDLASAHNSSIGQPGEIAALETKENA